MEADTALTAAYRMLDLDIDNIKWPGSRSTEASFSLNPTGVTALSKSLGFSASENVGRTAHVDYFNISTGSAALGPCAAADTSGSIPRTCLEGSLRVRGAPDWATLTEELVCVKGEARRSSHAGFTDVTALFSEPTEDSLTNAHHNAFSQIKPHSMTVGAAENMELSLWATLKKSTCSFDNVTDLQGHKDGDEEEERLDSHWDATMHEGDQDNSDYGDLPEYIVDLLHDDNQLMHLVHRTAEQFRDSLLSGDDFLNDAAMTTELQRQENKLSARKLSGRKRQRELQTQSQQAQVENTPFRTKRFRATVADSESGPRPSGLSHLAAAPARILQLPPSIHFITIPDNPGCAVVQTVKLSPPVVQLPIQNTAAPHTYILVPSTSPPSKCQLQPLSPVGGAVAPVQMSSSPPGSLSDSASRAMSPRQIFPLPPRSETSPCKESSCPQSPTVLNVTQVVKDYIREVKAHMNRTCLCIEEGLSLTCHCVDVPVSQREMLCSGKNTNKELRIMGDTDRQKTLLERSQIFRDLHGHNKRYILLLGNAGMGKTTLIKKLFLDWSTDCIPQFDFVFVLDKKALFLTRPCYSLQTLLLNLSSFVPPCLDPDAVYAQILAASKRVLLIFDGFEELRDYEILIQTQDRDLMTSLQKDSKAGMFTVRQLYSAILQRALLPDCTLLLTSRPRGAASQLLRRVNSILEVCGFSTSDIETYLSRYFTDPVLRASALDCLKNSSYLHLLCWNPGLCRLVCMVLEHSKTLGAPPRTLTELCHQVLCLKLEKSKMETQVQTQTSLPSVKGNQSLSNIQTQIRPDARRRRQRARKNQTKEKNEMEQEERRSVGQEACGVEEKNFMDQLSSLAWETVKANSSILPTGHTLSAKFKDFALRTRLICSHPLRKEPVVPKAKEEKAGRDNPDKKAGDENQNKKGIRGRKAFENVNPSDDCVLFWANPFLQSYLAGVHLSLSRNVSERHFLQALPALSGPKGRRRHQIEEQGLTQRFAVSLLFHNRTLLQRLLSFTKTSFKNTVSKQTLVAKQLQGLLYGDLSPAQILEVCHCMHEASTTYGEGNRGSCSAQLVSHMVENLPAFLSFCGIPLRPPDVFTVKYILEKGGAQGRGFRLDLEDTGIQVSGLKSVVGLNNIKTYRACVADVIALWEQLEESGEEELLQQAVSKLELYPLKITQVCHVEHLAKLVDIHVHKRLSDSCTQSDSILAEGVPAIRELRKLEFELGPDRGPLGLPRLWELLPGLMNLQHLDLENNKIGDGGSEMLANTLITLPSLEILNLSQNCIGDRGVKKLAPALKSLPKLHSLSLYSNMISDEGAEKLASVLPLMASLTDLDVKYNKLTDVGAISLGASLRNCRNIKTLRMWNQCIPYGVFERLKQQDSRILWH